MAAASRTSSSTTSTRTVRIVTERAPGRDREAETAFRLRQDPDSPRPARSPRRSDTRTEPRRVHEADGALARLVLALSGLLAACGGGGSDSGIASLDGKNQASKTSSKKSAS